MACVLAVSLLLAMPARAAETLTLYGAGSLRAALGEVVRAYEQAYGAAVDTEFAASGILRERIEDGARPDLFASANMAHPQKLMAQGVGGPVVLFARNRLCALAQPGLSIAGESVLDVMLRDDIKLGTSTPKADPSGDYAWALFRKAEALKPGSYARLDAKALKLTGGPESRKPPEGRNTYGWVMSERQADVFLTYCTNARLARTEVPGLQIVELPEPLAVGADYGLSVINVERPEAWRLAFFILSPEGQRILRDHGFAAAAVPAES